MVKKNGLQKWGKDPKNWFYLILTILLLWLIAYFAFGFDIAGIMGKLVAGLSTLIGGFGFSLGNGNFNGNGLVPEGDIPTDDLRCTEYDIAFEYDRYFGTATMLDVETACNLGGGTFVRRDNELSCFFDMPTTQECDAGFLAQSTDLCESMNAVPVCDNDIGLFGCFCTQAGADIPEGTTEEEGDGMQEIPIRIFVTDTQWTGPMGTIEGADEKCGVEAAFAGLSGNWKAILSDSTTDAKDRVPNPRIPYYYSRIDGVKIADDHNDLFDGSLDNPININQKGEAETGYAWTGSTTAGINTGDNCQDWKWVSSTGTIGSITTTGWSWIDAATSTCDKGAHLYCVEWI